MTKHTEGPWKIGHISEELIYINSPKATLAKVHEESYLNGKANAQLIAAAPELLEADKKALNFLNSYPGFDAGNPNHPAPLTEILRRAIAKAEGDSND